MVSIDFCVLNVKALVGPFNQEKALVGAFSMIVLHRLIDLRHYFYLSNDHAQHLTAAYLWRGEERGGFVEITHSIELGPATRCWL